MSVEFKVGQWVRSAPVRHKGAFTGEITEKLSDGDYVVRDAEKRRWLRHWSELTPAKAKENA